MFMSGENILMFVSVRVLGCAVMGEAGAMEMGGLTKAEWRRWRGDRGWGLMVGWDGLGGGGGGGYGL